MKSKGLVAALAALIAGAGLGLAPTHAAGTLTNDCIDSVPEPETPDPVSICYSLYQPADAPVPLIFHSHGWGGSRTNEEGSFANWMNAGFGVLSFDQRGFGESGGAAHVQNPAYEGKDVQALVDLVAGLDWVEQDSPGDPVIGAIGGSYGGGYQFVGAFSELDDRGGATRFDALAPEITWWDLQESLAPQAVVRTAWVSALFATGVGSLPNEVRQAFVEGSATGEWPDGSGPTGADMNGFFERTGPKWHATGHGGTAPAHQLDIPVLFGQGMSDNLFNANQGLQNWDAALTPAARAESIFVGYNGGHTLPNVLPPSGFPTGDPCSQIIGGNDFEALAIKFFTEKLKGGDAGLDSWYGTVNLATVGGLCHQGLGTDAEYPIGTAVTTTAAGPPIHLQVASGPITVAGVPSATADVTQLGVDGRAFFALSVGQTPADALVVQDNVMPIHEHDALPGERNHRTVELPGVAVDVPAGQNLYLTISAFSDMSFGHGSRVPGALQFENLVVTVPKA